MTKLSFIIPCYFNELNIPVTSSELIKNELLFPENTSFEYILVDDGSKDNTWNELINFRNKFPDKVKIIRLASNVGSFNAILAGMHYATGDCCVILAADLQDPPELIPKMFEYWLNNIKLVIANRQDREESWSQKIFSNTFHYLVKRFALKNVPPGGFDLVLFDKKLKDEIIRINEKNSNILYLLAWLGYDYVNIPYTRKKRELGKSRWTLRKKIKMFIDSFVAFSFFPIRMISVTGIFLGFLAMLYAIFIVISKIAGWEHTTGWSSLMVAFLSISSFQMIALGVIGEYVWRNLDETRKRPNFIVKDTMIE